MGSITRSFANNITTAGKFDGTKLTGDIPEANLSANAPAFDDNKIVNDLSTLGLRVHTQENLIASNTNSQYVDVFQDSSGYTNGADTVRSSDEHISTGTESADTNCQFLINSDTGLTDLSSNNLTITNNGVSVHTAQTKFGTNSFRFNGSSYLSLADHDRWRYNPANWTWEAWIYFADMNPAREYSGLFGQNDSSNTKQNIFQFTNSGTNNTLRHQSDGYGIEAYYGQVSQGQWYHIANVANASAGTVDVYVDGVRRSTSGGATDNTINLSDSDVASVFWIGNRNYNGSSDNIIKDSYWDSIRISNTPRYTGASFTPSTTRLSANIITTNATGNFSCPAITAGSSTSKMGAVITYQDFTGTNALNTDIVLQLSADNGSNFSTATLTALPDFSSGIKMAKVNDLSVTPGTQLKYKISFANQATGSKVARIRGVSLNY